MLSMKRCASVKRMMIVILWRKERVRMTYLIERQANGSKVLHDFKFVSVFLNLPLSIEKVIVLGT